MLRDKKTGTFLKESLEDKFKTKYQIKENGCWEWTSHLFSNGYGCINEYENKKTKCLLAHRVSYSLFNGEIPPNMVVMHTCDNPKCVNPKHLVIGTQKENIHDMINKGRKSISPHYGENNGSSKLTEEKVKSILKLRYENKEKVSNIANVFSVSKALIEKIISGRLWTQTTRPILAGYGLLGGWRDID